MAVAPERVSRSVRATNRSAAFLHEERADRLVQTASAMLTPQPANETLDETSRYGRPEGFFEWASCALGEQTVQL